MKLKQSQNKLIVHWGAGTPFVIALACVICGVGVAIAVFFLHSAELTGLINVGIFLALMGAAILGFLKTKTTILSKEGMSTYTEKPIIGGSQKSTSFQIDQITNIRLLISSGIGSTSHQLIGTLLLVMKDNSTLQIGFASKNVSTSVLNNDPTNLPKTPLYSESVKIAEFVGLPLEVPGVSATQNQTSHFNGTDLS